MPALLPVVVPLIVPWTPSASVPIAGAAAVLIAAVVALSVVCHTPLDVRLVVVGECRLRRKNVDFPLPL